MFGLFPPNSNDTLFRLDSAAAFATILPTWNKKKTYKNYWSDRYFSVKFTDPLQQMFVSCHLMINNVCLLSLDDK